MAGFENDVLLCKNINFDTAAPKPHIGIITAGGQLPIGTGNTSPIPEILAGSITSPDSSIVVGYSSPNITIETAAPSSAGAWEFISSATASSSATVEFTDLDATHFMYMVVIDSVQPANDSVVFNMRTSSNNGSSFDSGGSDYYGGTAIRLRFGSNNMGNAANETGSFIVNVVDPSSSSFTKVIINGQYINTSGSNIDLFMCDARRSTTPVNAIQFLMSTENISTGTFKLYGLSPS